MAWWMWLPLHFAAFTWPWARLIHRWCGIGLVNVFTHSYPQSHLQAVCCPLIYHRWSWRVTEAAVWTFKGSAPSWICCSSSTRHAPFMVALYWVDKLSNSQAVSPSGVLSACSLLCDAVVILLHRDVGRTPVVCTFVLGWSPSLAVTVHSHIQHRHVHVQLTDWICSCPLSIQFDDIIGEYWLSLGWFETNFGHWKHLDHKCWRTAVLGESFVERKYKMQKQSRLADRGCLKVTALCLKYSTLMSSAQSWCLKLNTRCLKLNTKCLI